MTLEHLQWEKSGRTYRDIEDPNKFVCLTSVNARNVWDEAGQEWRPYIWDAPNLYWGGDGEIDLSNNIPKFKRAGKFLTSNSTFTVQRETSPGVWEDEPHGSPTRNIQYDYPEEGYCIAYLNFPDAQYDLQIGLIVGQKARAQFGFRFRAPISRRVRFVWTMEGIHRIPVGDFNWINDKGGKKIGVRFKNFHWRWKLDEADERSIEVTGQGSQRTLAITYGPFDYVADTWLEVSPDSTTLEAGWAADINASQDCYPADTSDWCGDAGGGTEIYRTAERWDISGIDAGWDITNTEVRYYVEVVHNAPGTLNVNRYGTSHGEDNPQTDCGNGANPYTQCAGTNYNSIAEPGAASWTDWIDCGATADSDIEWCRDNTKGTWACGAVCPSPGGTDDYLEFTPYFDANDAELRITYTTGVSAFPMAMNHYRMRRA